MDSDNDESQRRENHEEDASEVGKDSGSDSDAWSQATEREEEEEEEEVGFLSKAYLTDESSVILHVVFQCNCYP